MDTRALAPSVGPDSATFSVLCPVLSGSFLDLRTLTGLVVYPGGRVGLADRTEEEEN